MVWVLRSVSGGPDASLQPGSNAIPFEGLAPCLGFNEAPQMQSIPFLGTGTMCSKDSNESGIR
jgi:hypothetical protein